MQGMLWILVSVICALAMTGSILYERVVKKRKYYTIGEDIVSVFAVAFFSAIAGALVGLVISTALPLFGTMAVIDHVDTPLATMQDGMQTNGSFFLGCGVIDGEVGYTYYTNNNGTYRLNNVPAINAIVVQDTKAPFVRSFYVVGFENKMLDFLFWHDVVEIGTKYEFHVLPGTVRSNFTLDAQ